MNARDAALLRLDSVLLPGWPKDTLGGRFRGGPNPRDPRDVALAETIYVSTIKFHLLFRYLVRHYSSRRLAAVDLAVQKVLSIAFAQLRFVTRIPPAVVVDEAVEQCKRLRLGKASGFVNAVLRRAVAEPNPPLPDESDLRRHVEITLSHPFELYQRLERLVGREKALRLCRRHNDEPPTIVRLLPGKTIRDLRADGVTLTAHEQAGMVVVEGATRDVLADWSHGGIAQVQDPTAARVVDALDLADRQLVLDRCCGVGTKTLQIVERVRPDGAVVAMDSSAGRLRLLDEMARRRGVLACLRLRAGRTMAEADLPGHGFDRILIDAPCSNSGVLMRRPEARYRQSDRSIGAMRQIQLELLLDTLPALAPGGRLVYSTCSIWDEENGQVVRDALARRDDCRLVRVKTTLPSLSDEARQHHDGGFIAIIDRTA